MRKDFLPRLYLPLLMLLVAVHSWRPLGGGYDFFAHAAVGRWIWNHGAVPTHGLFIWSAPNYPWVAHSWLSQLFFYGIIQLGGPFAVMVFTLAGVCLVFALIWRMWQQRGAIMFLTPLLFALAMWCSAPRFVPRQELITALFLVVLLAYLVAWREARIGSEIESSRERPFLEPASFGIVAIFALWVNLHALVLLGLIFMFGTALCDAAQDRLDRRSRALMLIAVLCLAATLLNPFGAGYWQAAAVLRPGSQASFVDEWKPFYLKPLLHWHYVAGEAVLALLSIFAWLKNPNRRWSHLLWIVMMSVLFVRSRRFLWMSAITFLVVMAANARSFDSLDWWTRWRKISKQPQLLGIPRGMRFLAHAGAVLVLVIWIAMIARVFPNDPKQFWPPRAISRDAPVQVAQIIMTRRLPGRIFNDYENSSYLQWSLNGEDAKGNVPSAGLHPLFIDLLNAYPDSVMDPDYFGVLEAKPAGLALLDKKKVNTIHLGDGHRKDAIVKWLNKNRAWKKLLDNDEGILWTRRQPK